MTAVPTRLKATDPTRLIAELGLLPADMDWTHLLTPIRLHDLLLPAEDDAGDDEDELPPWT
ncbi:hypothetical protein [Streptomyces violascens]|uniref:hypothetical protein n=1 Tax=Streptomyces violascens TaxID=67381 RepID=UPI0036B0F8B4